jgi:hypothetical protein
MQDHQKARDNFYTAVRAELGIVSGDIPLGSGRRRGTKVRSNDHKWSAILCWPSPGCRRRHQGPWQWPMDQAWRGHRLRRGSRL